MIVQICILPYKRSINQSISGLQDDDGWHRYGSNQQVAEGCQDENDAMEFGEKRKWHSNHTTHQLMQKRSGCG